MLARLRARLTYANVMATLALFVALGGTSYAALSITSKDVKNRSLKGGDLRRDTVTGKEIRESKLGRVPSATNAASADIAKSADSATTATTATTATSAGSASVAGIAQDAQALAGQGAGAFERSSRTQFGRASANPAGTSGEQALFAWPELGVEVRTSTDQCGGGGGTSFALRSTKGAGGANLEFTDAGNAAGTVAPGATTRECSSNGDASVDAEVSDAQRTLFIDCINAAGELRCIGIRSEP